MWLFFSTIITSCLFLREVNCLWLWIWLSNVNYLLLWLWSVVHNLWFCLTPVACLCLTLCYIDDFLWLWFLYVHDLWLLFLIYNLGTTVCTFCLWLWFLHVNDLLLRFLIHNLGTAISTFCLRLDDNVLFLWSDIVLFVSVYIITVDAIYKT